MCNMYMSMSYMQVRIYMVVHLSLETWKNLSHGEESC